MYTLRKTHSLAKSEPINLQFDTDIKHDHDKHQLLNLITIASSQGHLLVLVRPNKVMADTIVHQQTILLLLVSPGLMESPHSPSKHRRRALQILYSSRL